MRARRLIQKHSETVMAFYDLDRFDDALRDNAWRAQRIKNIIVGAGAVAGAAGAAWKAGRYLFGGKQVTSHGQKYLGDRAYQNYYSRKGSSHYPVVPYSGRTRSASYSSYKPTYRSYKPYQGYTPRATTIVEQEQPMYRNYGYRNYRGARVLVTRPRYGLSKARRNVVQSRRRRMRNIVVGRAANYRIQRPLRRMSYPTCGQDMKCKYLNRSAFAVPEITADFTGLETADDQTDYHLTPVSQGTGVDERIGRKIMLHKLDIRGYLHWYEQNVTGTDPPKSYAHVKIFIVQDLASNGAQCQTEEVWQDVGGEEINFTTCFRNQDYNNRFRILKSLTFGAQPSGYVNFNSGMQEPNRFRHWRIKVPVKGLQITWDTGTSTSISAIRGTSLHIFAFCNYLGSASTHPAIQPYMQWEAKLRFTG